MKKLFSTALAVLMLISLLSAPPALAAPDTGAKTLVPLEYESIGGFSNGLAVALRDGKYGVIDLAGRVVIPFAHEYLSLVGENAACFTKDGKYGLIGLGGKELVPAVYDSIERFSGGRAVVKLGGKYGVIDRLGSEIAPPEYDSVYTYHRGLAVVTRGGLMGCIDMDGKLVVPEEYAISGFVDGLAPARRGDEWYLIKAPGGGLIPVGAPAGVKYDAIYSFAGGYALVQAGNKYGMTDSAGKILVPAEYDEVKHFSEGMAAVRNNGKWGYVDSSGTLAVPCSYTAAGNFIGGLATVVSGKKAGLIGRDGRLATPVEYDAIHDPDSDGMRCAQKNGLYGFLDASGKLAIPCRYINPGSFAGGCAAVATNEGTAIIDKTGKTLSWPQSAYGLGNGLFWSNKYGTDSLGHPVVLGVGVIDKYGNEVLPKIYSHHEGLGPDFFLLCVGGNIHPEISHLWVGGTRGVMDRNGRLVLPAEYDSVTPCWNIESGTPDPRYDGLVIVSREGKCGIIKLPSPADIPSAWATEHIATAIGAGLVPDRLQGFFTRSATRAEFCALAVALYESITYTEITELVGFTDAWQPEVWKMAGLGIVSGVGDGRFDPDGPVTREQAALILTRLMESLGGALDEAQPKFADSSAISDWAADSVGKMQESGIMAGTGGGNFSPKGSFTIEQSVTTLLKIYDLLNVRTIPEPPPKAEE